MFILILMNGLMQDMIEHLSRLIWSQSPTPTIIQMQRLSLEFRGSFSTTALPKMSCQKFMPVSMMPRPEQITLRRPGRNLLTKLAGKSKLLSTAPHLVCS